MKVRVAADAFSYPTVRTVSTYHPIYNNMETRTSCGLNYYIGVRARILASSPIRRVRVSVSRITESHRFETLQTDMRKVTIQRPL